MTLGYGQSVVVALSFQPTAIGPVQGLFTVSSNDPVNPTQSATLTGTGGVSLDCQLGLTPAALDYGGVVVGQVGELGVRIANTGPGNCSIWNGVVTGDRVVLAASSATVLLARARRGVRGGGPVQTDNAGEFFRGPDISDEQRCAAGAHTPDGRSMPPASSRTKTIRIRN